MLEAKLGAAGTRTPVEDTDLGPGGVMAVVGTEVTVGRMAAAADTDSRRLVGPGPG